MQTGEIRVTRLSRNPDLACEAICEERLNRRMVEAQRRNVARKALRVPKSVNRRLSPLPW